MFVETIVVVDRDEIKEVIPVIGKHKWKTHRQAQRAFIAKCRKVFGDGFTRDQIETGDPMRCTGLGLSDEDQEGTTVFLWRPDTVVEA